MSELDDFDFFEDTPKKEEKTKEEPEPELKPENLTPTLPKLNTLKRPKTSDVPEQSRGSGFQEEQTPKEKKTSKNEVRENITINQTGKRRKIQSQRIEEILGTQKPSNSKDRKKASDYYLKRLILLAFEEFFQQYDEKVQINFE